MTSKRAAAAAEEAHILPAELQQRAVRVVLAGAGGTGSQVLTGLARLHVALLALGHPAGLDVTVYDPDAVSESNIGRQLFSRSDVGQSKAIILVNRINLWFGTGWKAEHRRYTPGDHERPYNADIVITCVDTAKARREIAAGLDLLKIVGPHYLLDCGNDAQTGQVFLTRTRPLEVSEFGWEPASKRNIAHMIPTTKVGLALPALKDVLPEIFDARRPESDRPSCSLPEALEEQGLYINQHVATWAMTLLEKLFRDGRLTICGYWINLLEGRVVPHPIRSIAAGDPEGRDQWL